ncbi:helix-turn-helix domain-containing protein [Dietzia lutea]|nr:ATP-binding protein [Dietzia lutea]
MTQPDFRWSPRTEAELQMALTSGLLEETHYLDLKRELAPGRSGSKGIAKDLAAFAIDGGMILVGVDEGEDPTQPPSLTPQPLDGMAERVEQIAQAAISDPVRVQTTAIPSTDEPSKGYLAIRVNPSPRAPHMVDGRYYGRGDKTNVILSHDDVMRHHRRLLSDRSDLQLEAKELLDEIDPTASLIALIADPIGLRDDLLVELTGDPNWENQVAAILQQADQTAKGADYPPYIRATGFQRRAEGVAVTDGMHNATREFKGDGRAAELVFHETGRLTLISERATFMHTRPVQPEPPAAKLIFEELIVAKTAILVAVTAETAKLTQYRGSWRFALLVRGLKGGSAWILADSFGFSNGSGYTADTYARETEAAFADIATDPNAVARDLTMPLLRSLGVHTHSKFQWMRNEQAQEKH